MSRLHILVAVALLWGALLHLLLAWEFRESRWRGQALVALALAAIESAAAVLLALAVAAGR